MAALELPVGSAAFGAKAFQKFNHEREDRPLLSRVPE
jgi:hypothetical protein